MGIINNHFPEEQFDKVLNFVEFQKALQDARREREKWLTPNKKDMQRIIPLRVIKNINFSR